MVDEMAMYEALAAQNGIRLVSIPKLNPAPSMVTMLPLELCEQKRVIACALLIVLFGLYLARSTAHPVRAAATAATTSERSQA